MKIKDAMTKHPTYLHPEATLREVAEQMKILEAGIIPIGDDKRLLGMITDRNIALSLAEGCTPDSKASKIMSKEVFYCYQNDSLDEASECMGKLQVRRLIVLDSKDNKKFVGIVSMGDIARCSHDLALCGQIVDKVSKDIPSRRQH